MAAPRYYKPIPPVRADLLPITRQALKAWLGWVEAGCPEHPVFWLGTGLCHNLRKWDGRAGRDVAFALIRAAGDYRRGHYPFGDYRRYHWETTNSRTHENKHRLAWVRANLPEED